MACNTPNCSDASSAGTGANVVTIPQRACSGATFCDDNLEGLPFSQGVDLVGVPEGDSCLHRVAAAKGIWQHDPARAGGADFVGPIEGIKFQPGENMPTDECGHLPMLRDVTVAGGPVTLELVKQDVSVNSYGDLTSTTTCKGGKVRQDIIEPEVYDDANPCEANLSLLGFVRQVVIENGVNKTRKVWKALTRILFPDTQITKFTGVDLTDGNSWRAVVAKKRGNCWELGLDEEAEDTSDDCSLYASVGTAFPYLLACDGGTMKKVEPQNGMSLVGDGTSWKLAPAGMTRLSSRHFIGQEYTGFANSANISTAIDDLGTTSGSTNGTFDMTTLTGYTAGRRIAWVRAVTYIGLLNPAGAVEAIAQVDVNGEVIAETWNDTAHSFCDSDKVVYPVALTDDKFTYNLITSTSNLSTGQAYAKLEVVGWE